MDRRRFNPSTERLDDRVLLSGATANLITTVNTNKLDRTARIANLGFILNTLAPNRVVPESLVTPLQADLTAEVGRLSNPGTVPLTAANQQYRSTLSHSSITTLDVAGLSATFGNALTAAGSPLALTNTFQKDMVNLLQFDTQHNNPTILATNDYATVLQLALSVGRPIATPPAPRLLSTDAIGGGSHATYQVQPHLVGSYAAGTYMTLFDQNGNNLGIEEVPSTGNYEIQVSKPLSPGTYYLRVQAYDANGNHSQPSPAYRLVVKAKPVKVTGKAATPAGPLSL